MTNETPFTEADLRSLGEKLATLDLTDAERWALAELLAVDDVSGFSRFDLAGDIRKGTQTGGLLLARWISTNPQFPT